MQISGILDQVTGIVEYVTNYAYVFKLIASVSIFSIFWGFRSLFTKYIFRLIVDLLHGSKFSPEESFLSALRDPIKNLIILIGAYLAWQNYLPERFNSFINDVFKSGIIVLSASAVYALIGYYTASERKNHRIFNHEVDKILLPFFSKVVRIVVLALAFVAIASKWGYDVNGFIAGLGLGGLAFALAAKDLLANVFSGIVIITDKPYSIGDWIKTSEFEGTIENINFRSTRIRAFDQALVIVPNFNLINAPIINFTRRSIRRITFQIGVTYTTPAYKLKKCITEMEEVLRNHPDIDQQTIVVKFDSFGNGALQLLLCFFAKTIVWEEYLDIKQDINLKIMGVLETQGVSLAFPSTSVYLETPVQFHKQE